MERTTKGMTRVKNAVEGRKETRRNEEKAGKGMSARGKNGRIRRRKEETMRIKSEGRDGGMRSKRG